MPAPAPKVARECQQCHAYFEVLASDLARRPCRGKFCDRDCANRAMEAVGKCAIYQALYWHFNLCISQIATMMGTSRDNIGQQVAYGGNSGKQWAERLRKAEAIAGAAKLMEQGVPPRPAPRPDPPPRQRKYAPRRRYGPEVMDEVVRLYEAGYAHARIAATVAIGRSTVLTILRKRRVKLRGSGKRWVHCCECGKPTGGAQRCPLHKRLHLAKKNRVRMRRANWTPKARYMVVDSE